jgi:hypothetical protein
MDLKWTFYDGNALPLNPLWAYQENCPQSSPDPYNDCTWPKNDTVAVSCTSQVPEINARVLPQKKGKDQCTIFSHKNTFCWACPSSTSKSGTVPGGHFNWYPVTYQGGTLRFGAFESDFVHDKDVNLEYHSLNGAGTTTGDKEDGSLHLEFYSHESLVFFGSPWWESFKRMKAGERKRALPGGPSSVTGLLGLDCEHFCKAEIHPVFALSARVNESPDHMAESWVFFLRNWGDEGYCGSKLYFLSGLDMNPSDGSSLYVVHIPWKEGMATMTVQKNSTVMSNHAAVEFESIQCGAGGGAEMRFRMPPAASEFPRIDGQLLVKWSKDAGPQGGAPNVAQGKPDAERVRSRLSWVFNPDGARGAHPISRKDDRIAVRLPTDLTVACHAPLETDAARSNGSTN